MRKLSIIIPMYNVEQYLHKCISSIYKQGLDENEFEVILVDDGSPDKSFDTALSLTQDNSNVRIIRQSNKGLGGARNTGILNAKGEYLLFLDADDWILDKSIVSVIEILEINKIDVLEFRAQRISEDGKVLDDIFEVYSESLLTGTDYIARIGINNSACNKFYRREFLIDEGILFIENVYVEDAPFNTEVYCKANKVIGVQDILVCFLQNSKSITRAHRNDFRTNKFINDSKIVTSRINNFVAFDGLNIDGKKKILEKVAMFTSGLILMIIRSGKTKKEKEKDLEDLIDLELYPIKTFTDVWIRNVFITLVNQRWFLRFLLLIR